jgi:hypothetical protein
MDGFFEHVFSYQRVKAISTLQIFLLCSIQCDSDTLWVTAVSNHPTNEGSAVASPVQRVGLAQPNSAAETVGLGAQRVG